MMSGGWSVFESHVYKQVVEEKAARTPGKKSLAIEAYARALRAIPGTICDNAGELSHLSVLGTAVPTPDPLGIQS
jgi:T-complex protein 1 subunit beta